MLNLQGATTGLPRGRLSDYFVFTPHFVGSMHTGYCRTEQMLAAFRSRPGPPRARVTLHPGFDSPDLRRLAQRRIDRHLAGVVAGSEPAELRR